jgi:exopolysaccharide biosynthesis protein
MTDFMKMKENFRILLVTCLIIKGLEAGGQMPGFSRINWEREKIVPGLIWKSAHTVLNDTVMQNINILLINLRKREISLIYDPVKNSPVSIQAESAKGLAAVNAGFFNIKNGGSVTYIKTDGLIADSDTARKWTRNSNMTGSVLISSAYGLFIREAMVNEWYDKHLEFEDVLVTGPLLIRGGEMVKLPETSLVISRHPRTAAGTRNNSKRVVLLTIDGRTGEASGMTLPELAEFMKLLRCRDAVNLDGGGSTTMWISGRPFNGIVNMPSDNKKFDHYGERAVSDILVIK